MVTSSMVLVDAADSSVSMLTSVVELSQSTRPELVVATRAATSLVKLAISLACFDTVVVAG